VTANTAHKTAEPALQINQRPTATGLGQIAAAVGQQAVLPAMAENGQPSATRSSARKQAQAAVADSQPVRAHAATVQLVPATGARPEPARAGPIVQVQASTGPLLSAEQRVLEAAARAADREGAAGAEARLAYTDLCK
jgi:hypothetical protein